MGGEPYWYFVPYQSNIQAALDSLRAREFKAGRYNPVMPFQRFTSCCTRMKSRARSCSPVSPSISGRHPHKLRSELEECSRVRQPHSRRDALGAAQRYSPGTDA